MKKEQNESNKRKVDWLREENTKLKEKIESLSSELGIVNWYTKVMEAGIDSKKMMKLYKKSKEKIDLYADIRIKEELIEKHKEQ